MVAFIIYLLFVKQKRGGNSFSHGLLSWFAWFSPFYVSAYIELTIFQYFCGKAVTVIRDGRSSNGFIIA